MSVGGTLSYAGGNCPAGTTCTGSNFGMLTLPVNIIFSDALGTNTTSSPVSVTDDWLFGVPAASAGASITGEQISLSNFTVGAAVDSFTLYRLNGSSPRTLIGTGTPNGPLSQLIIDPSVSAGSYELEVTAHLNANSTGNYTADLVAAAPAPAPLASVLLLSGLGGLFTLTRRRA